MKKVWIGLFFMAMVLLGSQQSTLAFHNMGPNKWISIGCFEDDEKYFIKEDILRISRKIYQSTENPLERTYMSTTRHTLKKGGFVIQLFQYDFLNKKQRILGFIQHDVFGKEIKNTLEETAKVPWEDIKENTPDAWSFFVAKQYIVEGKNIRALYEFNVKQKLEDE